MLTEKEKRKMIKETTKLHDKIDHLELKVDSSTKNAVKEKAKILALREELATLENKILFDTIEKMNIVRQGLILFSYDGGVGFHWNELKIYKIVGLNSETFDGTFEVVSVKKTIDERIIMQDDGEVDFDATWLHNLLVYQDTFDSDAEASAALKEVLSEESPTFLLNLIRDHNMEKENNEEVEK